VVSTAVAKAISELHNLIGSFSDATSLKACGLVLNKATPILTAIGAELRQLPHQTGID